MQSRNKSNKHWPKVSWLTMITMQRMSSSIKKKKTMGCHLLVSYVVNSGRSAAVTQLSHAASTTFANPVLSSKYWHRHGTMQAVMTEYCSVPCLFECHGQLVFCAECSKCPLLCNGNRHTWLTECVALMVGDCGYYPACQDVLKTFLVLYRQNRKTGKCAACDQPTQGIFNIATDITKKLKYTKDKGDAGG